MTRSTFQGPLQVSSRRYNTGMKRRAGVVNPFSLVARVTLRRRPLRHLRHRRIRGLQRRTTSRLSNGLFRFGYFSFPFEESTLSAERRVVVGMVG